MFKTIVAPATPIAYSALAVIRLSGDDALLIGAKWIKLPKDKLLEDIPSHQATFAYIIDPKDNSLVDEVMFVIYKAPRSYTGETMLEITCHGNPLIIEKILFFAQQAGAVLALAGEFTQRSFLAGKKDLTQSEAVLNLVHAKQERLIASSLETLTGKVKKNITHLKNSLENILLYLEAELDFSEEQIDFLDQDSFVEQINPVIESCIELENIAEKTSLLSKALSVVFIGQPNVGKSSLFNALLDKKRSIVTSIPGTTRDVIDAEIVLNSSCIRLVDTAGLRESEDLIEQKGIVKSKEELEKANLILFVLSADKFDEEDICLWEKIQRIATSNQKILIIINKKDVLQENIIQKIKAYYKNNECLLVSSFDLVSVRELEKYIEQQLIASFDVDSSPFIVTHRQKLLLNQAIQAMCEAKTKNLDQYQEIIVLLLKDALSSLSEILGEHYHKDLLEEIFSRFCIGK